MSILERFGGSQLFELGWPSSFSSVLVLVVDHERVFLAFAYLSAQLLRLAVAHPRLGSRKRARCGVPQHEDMDSAIGQAVMPARSNDGAGYVSHRSIV